MEASALRHAARVPVLTGLSPHLRLQSDERLVALVRRGHHGAFEALVRRYQPRLLAFCRHMLGSNEDAEDVLQEVFTSAYNAICADDRPIAARPWLYRIARNRCLNHLRRPQDAGQESMDVFEREEGATTADTVHRREEFRQIVADVQDLPETQRSALLLREIDALSYDQIAAAMETTVPSVKSLLVRARMSLAEASEARQMTCGEVRLVLSQAAEGIAKASPPARRHVRSCPRCRTFKRELRRTSHAFAAMYPILPLLAAKKLIAKVGGGSAAAEGAGGSSVAGGGALMGSGAAGVLSAGTGSILTKATAGLVVAALVTAGAVEVRRGDRDREASGGVAEASPAPKPARARPPDLTVTREPGPARRTHEAAAVAPATDAEVSSEPVPAGTEEGDQEVVTPPGDEDTAYGTEAGGSTPATGSDGTATAPQPPGSSSDYPTLSPGGSTGTSEPAGS